MPLVTRLVPHLRAALRHPDNDTFLAALAALEYLLSSFSPHSLFYCYSFSFFVFFSIFFSVSSLSNAQTTIECRGGRAECAPGVVVGATESKDERQGPGGPCGPRVDGHCRQRGPSCCSRHQVQDSHFHCLIFSLVDHHVDLLVAYLVACLPACCV